MNKSTVVAIIGFLFLIGGGLNSYMAGSQRDRDKAIEMEGRSRPISGFGFMIMMVGIGLAVVEKRSEDHG